MCDETMIQTFLNGKIVCNEVEDIGHMSYYYVTTELGTDRISVWHNDSLEEKAKEVLHRQLWLTVLNKVCSADEFGIELVIGVALVTDVTVGNVPMNSQCY